MSINIKVKCDFCKEQIKDGITFLNLYGNYMKKVNILQKKDYVQELVKVDNIRPFWSMCDSCHSKLLNATHDDKIIIKFSFVQKKGDLK